MLNYKLNNNIFREYDIRGIVKEDFSQHFIYDLGMAIGTKFLNFGEKNIAVSGDLRKSTDFIKTNLIDISAIENMYRILKKGGSALVSVPIHPNYKITYEDNNILPEQYEEIYGHHDHVRACGLDYYKRFEKIGFTTQKLSGNEMIEIEIIKFGLRRDHIAYNFIK